MGKAKRRLSTARLMNCDVSSMRQRELSLLGSSSAVSIRLCISGVNCPMSAISFPKPSPKPAIPRVSASAEDRDLERCKAVPFRYGSMPFS